MIQTWAKLLPYWLLIWLLRNQSCATGYGTFITGKEYAVAFFQIDAGEFIVFSQEIQDTFDKRKESKRKNKLDKKLNKLNNKLRDDIFLKLALRKQFEDEIENEKQGW